MSLLDVQAVVALARCPYVKQNTAERIMAAANIQLSQIQSGKAAAPSVACVKPQQMHHNRRAAQQCAEQSRKRPTDPRDQEMEPDSPIVTLQTEQEGLNRSSVLHVGSEQHTEQTADSGAAQSCKRGRGQHRTTPNSSGTIQSSEAHRDANMVQSEQQKRHKDQGKTCQQPADALCEHCGQPHDRSYGSGRFCSQACRSRRNSRNSIKASAANSTNASAAKSAKTDNLKDASLRRQPTAGVAGGAALGGNSVDIDLSKWKSERSSSGYRGVRPSASGKFRAHIVLDKAHVSIGTFSTAEEAATAYAKRYLAVHGAVSERPPADSAAAPRSGWGACLEKWATQVPAEISSSVVMRKVLTAYTQVRDSTACTADLEKAILCVIERATDPQVLCAFVAGGGLMLVRNHLSSKALELETLSIELLLCLLARLPVNFETMKASRLGAKIHQLCTCKATRVMAQAKRLKKIYMSELVGGEDVIAAEVDNSDLLRHHANLSGQAINHAISTKLCKSPSVANAEMEGVEGVEVVAARAEKEATKEEEDEASEEEEASEEDEASEEVEVSEVTLHLCGMGGCILQSRHSGLCSVALPSCSRRCKGRQQEVGAAAATPLEDPAPANAAGSGHVIAQTKPTQTITKRKRQQPEETEARLAGSCGRRGHKPLALPSKRRQKSQQKLEAKDSTQATQRAGERAREACVSKVAVTKDPSRASVGLLVGRCVEKHFDGHGVFSGRVKKYNAAHSWYLVEYEDGDTEELTELEVNKLLPSAAELLTPTEQQPAKKKAVSGVKKAEGDAGEVHKFEWRQARKMPLGWMQKVYECASQRTGFRWDANYMAPDGTRYTSKSAAVAGIAAGQNRANDAPLPADPALDTPPQAVQKPMQLERQKEEPAEDDQLKVPPQLAQWQQQARQLSEGALKIKQPPGAYALFQTERTEESASLRDMEFGLRSKEVLCHTLYLPYLPAALAGCSHSYFQSYSHNYSHD